MGSQPTPTPSAVTAAPLPPLPDLSSSAANAGGSPGQAPSGILAALMSGVAPVKTAVDQIMEGCKAIMAVGTIPGADQICGQIAALATSLLPLAAQSAMGVGGAGGGMQAMPPPPNGPAPMGAPGPGGGAPPPMPAGGM